MRVDERAQVSQMSREARAALAERIRSRLSNADEPTTDHDVCIVGGGVAALTLALELRLARPTTRILVIEPNAHPVPEITHTVGESTVEVSAHYLRDRLGLGDHLSSAHIRKMGLRMFFTHERNTDIAQRMEVGGSSFVPQVTYQIDRGRLENELAPALPVRRGWTSPSAGCVRSTSAPWVVPTRCPSKTVTSSRRPPRAGWSTPRAGTGCCPDSWTSSASTNTTAMPRGFESRPRSTSAGGATTRPGTDASSRATGRCPPTT